MADTVGVAVMGATVGMAATVVTADMEAMAVTEVTDTSPRRFAWSLVR